MITDAQLEKRVAAGDAEAAAELESRLVEEYGAGKRRASRSMELLGNFYFTGPEKSRDPQKAFAWFDRAERAGNTGVLDQLRYCYLMGIGVRKNKRRALEYAQRLAQKGDPYSLYYIGLGHLGRGYFDRGVLPRDPKKAVDYLKQAIRRRHTDALFALGDIYLYGVTGIPRDPAMGLRLIRQAANRGHAEACCRLGYCYHEGEGVKKDYKNAFIWVKRAAEAGDGWGKFYLGLNYFYGAGTRKNFKAARRWLESAVSDGVDDAAESLRELEQEMHRPKGTLNERAAAGDDVAMVDLADQLYRHKFRTPEEQEKILALWTRAAELGNSHAMFKPGAAL